MSKYQGYTDWHAKCPYYKGQWQSELQCEGLNEEARTVVMRFRTARGMREHRSRYCNKIDGFASCPLYAAHEE